MLFRNILFFTGAVTTGIGVFAVLVNYVPFLDVPNYSHKGNLVTGLTLISIGTYVLLLGIIDNHK